MSQEKIYKSLRSYNKTHKIEYDEISDIYSSEKYGNYAVDPVLRGYFCEWFIYKPQLPVAFPGYAENAIFDLSTNDVRENTKILNNNLNYYNELIYSFLGIKQNTNPKVIETYTRNQDWVGSVMIYDTWSATKKPIHNQWGVSSDEQIWMNSHRNCFPEKNSEGIKFDPSPENYNFPHMWMNYGNLEAFSKYKLGQIDEPRKMFGIGGCDERYIDGWISALNNPKTFAESLLDLAEHYNITGGVDLDWEPLSEVFGVLNNNFGSVAPLVNLVNTIKIEAANRGILDYKITFTASVDQQYIWDFDTLMPQKKGAWAELSRYVDQIEIAGYDMHGPFDQNKMTGLHSALFPVYKDKSGLSDAGAIQLLHELGVPYSKMILGIPSYARSVSGVTKPGLNQPFQEAYRGDVDIEDSWEEPIGVTSYKWITENIPALNIKIINDSSWPNAFCDLDQQDIPSQIGSYAYLDGVFHSFDTTKTAAAKAIYSKNIGLGGNMIWSVETDAPSPHSLARAIYDAWEIV